MNVTKSNFRESLTKLDAEIESSNFITVDCEFTGLSVDNKVLPYDSPDIAYRKIIDNTSGYIIIQLGLTLIRVRPDDPDKFTYRSYNFYVFPRAWKNTFRCQGASMIFLAENGFDFSRLFREGVSYCNQQEEQMLRERLLEKQKKREELKNATVPNTAVNRMPVPEDEKENIERIQKTIEEFIESEEDEKVIGGCNAFQRKLIYEMIEAKFYNTISASTKTADNAKLIVIQRKSTPEAQERLENELQQTELQELEDSIGISTVLQKISASKKPIIGHNMLLDLIFIFRQFFRPLPDDFREFKKFAHSIFPNIIDTKYLCTLPKLKSLIKSSVLAHVIQTVSEEPFSLPVLEFEDVNYSYCSEQNKAHEAGYDSYLTAKAFLGLANYLHGSASSIIKDSNETKEFINRIFLLKSNDVGYINLVGIEPVPSRDHVFHVTIPEVWKQLDLVNHFRNYGPIFVTWINSTSALVSLHNRENASHVLKTIGTCTGFKVQSFADYKGSLHYRINLNEAAQVARKRKRDSASNSPEEGSVEKKLKKSAQKKNDGHEDKVKPIVKTFIENNDWT